MKHLNLAILAVFIVLSIFVISGAIQLLHQPIILDYFYNPTLKMYEPVAIEPEFGWLDIVRFPAGLITYLFTSPLWFMLLYLVCGVWLLVVSVVYLIPPPEPPHRP